MVNSMVARATNSVHIGPDWAMNLEICDVCDRDPVQAKDVVKGIKKRLGNKNPKVQLLALTLLESIVKNCGDIVHLQVAERSLLSDMVKIVKKKKPDFHVKEKILILIDTWQEDFGGERGRYPQYYVAYLELLRLGANFPEKPARSAPVVLPPQTQAMTSVPPNRAFQENENEEADFPTLSLSEMQNARGVMDVLAEMLTAVDPEKKEGLRQDVIVDLVEQCRTYKRRLVHLVNSTSNESLLSQGLALNDELQRVLAKHEALLMGTRLISSEKSKPETSNPETSRALVPVAALKQPGSASGAGAQPDLITLAPVTNNGKSTSEKVTPVNFDLLSGDDFDMSTPSNSLAIVPVGETQPAAPVTQQNSLALVSVLSPQTQQPQNLLAQQQSFYPNRNVGQNQSWGPYNQGNNPVWNGHMAQQQQQQQQQLQLTSPGFGAMSGSLPPAPWEAPPSGNQLAGGGGFQYSQSHGLQNPGYNNMNTNNHMLPMNNQPVYTHQIPQQMAYMYPQQMSQQMYGNQMGQVYGFGTYGNGPVYGYGPGPIYGYRQQQNTQDSFLTSTVYTGPSMATASYVHVSSGKAQKAEDKLFGDLVDFSKVKPKKTAIGERM